MPVRDVGSMCTLKPDKVVWNGTRPFQRSLCLTELWGCCFVGPYGSFLLGIPETINPEIIPDYLKPGWTRVSLNYFISDEEAQYIIDAVAMVADMGHMLLPYYEFNEETGNWHSISDATEHLMSLKDLDITGFGPEKSENLTSATSATWRQDAEDERHLKMEQQMASAMILFEHLSAEGQPEVVVTAPAAKANKHRWYILPGEALRTIRVANDIRWQANDELLPALTKEEPPQIARDACVAIDPSKAPFLTTPWYSYGSEINGMSPGLKYMNENAVRARAGLLNATGWMSAFLILYLPPVYGVRPFLVIKYLASIALWEVSNSQSRLSLTCRSSVKGLVKC